MCVIFIRFVDMYIEIMWCMVCYAVLWINAVTSTTKNNIEASLKLYNTEYDIIQQYKIKTELKNKKRTKETLESV